MKKIAVVTVAALVIIGPTAVTAEAKKPKRFERTAMEAYDAPAPGVPAVAAGNCGSPNVGCAFFTAARTERFVSIAIDDASGQAPVGVVTVDGTNHEFCGATSEPIAVAPGSQVMVTVHAGASAEAMCPGIATNGSVTATFSNLP